MKPAASPTVGVSTGASAIAARLCPDVNSSITLPDEWTAKVPGDLLYVVDVQYEGTGAGDGCGFDLTDFNGYTFPVSTEVVIEKVNLINTQTGQVVNSVSVRGPEPNCQKVDAATLIGDPPSAQYIQQAIVGLLSNQVNSHTLGVLTGHTDAVTSVAFSPDGKLLASGSQDDTVILWDVSSGQEVRTLKDTHAVSSVAFSPDGKLLASGSRDDTVMLWDVASGQEVRTLTGHTDTVTSVAFSPDGKLLASGSQDDTVMLWDVASGQEVRTLTGHTDHVTSVAFSPDGKLLASGSQDDTVILWDVASGQEVRTLLTGHTHAVSSVAFSPDGKLLASGSQEDTVILWEVASGQEVRTLMVTGSLASDVTSVAFSPDGKLLATVSWVLRGIGSGNIGDSTVMLWDVASGQAVNTVTETGIVSRVDLSSVAFSPDGKLLASGSQDDTVKLREVKLP